MNLLNRYERASNVYTYQVSKRNYYSKNARKSRKISFFVKQHSDLDALLESARAKDQQTINNQI